MVKRWILAAAVLGSGIVFLDSLVVNVALPRIGHELPRSFLGVLEGQAYIYSGYLLSLCALLILAGALTDYYGRKRMFAIGLAAFGLTSLLCGVAPTMETLVLFRVLQGAAGALLVPGSLALITANFEGEEQGRAFGIWAGASAATTILGPVVGGILVDTVSWRAVFFLNVPLILVALWATYRHVPESRDEEASSHFDWIGALIVGLAVGGLAFGAIFGAQRDWRDATGFIGLAVGVVATAVLPFYMRRASHPLIPPPLFRSRNFTVTNIATLLIYGALYVNGYYVILYMQGILRYTAVAAGLTFLPGSLFLIFVSPRIGRIASRIGPRWFMAAGPAAMALAVLWYARIPVQSTGWMLRTSQPSTFIPPVSYLIDFLPASILFGIGLSLMVAPLTTALMRSVPVHNAGVASAINNAISRIGPQLAGALIFIFVTNSFYAYLSGHLGLADVNVASASFRSAVSPMNMPVDPNMVAAARDASTAAFHLAMLVSALLLVLGALASAIGITNAPVAAAHPVPAGGSPEIAPAAAEGTG